MAFPGIEDMLAAKVVKINTYIGVTSIIKDGKSTP